MAEQRPARWRALGNLLRPVARRWVGVASLVALSAAASVGGPLVLRSVIDRVGNGATVDDVRRLGLIFVAIAAIGMVATIVSVIAATATAWRTTNQLRLRITRHVLGLDHEFHRTHTPGELISRVDGDVTSVSDFLGKVLVKALRSLLMLIGAIGVLAVVQWPLAIAMTIYVVAAAAAVVATRNRAIDEAGEEMSANAALYGGIEERLNASEDLRSNGALDHAMRGFIGESRAVMVSAVRRARAFLSMWWVVQGSVAVGLVFALVSSAYLVNRGTMTIGTALLLFQYVLLVSRPLEDIVHELQIVQKANAAMERVIALLGETASIVDDGSQSPPPGALEVRAESMSFDYGDDQPVLSGVDLHIEAGATVGVIGRTGSGKTTFSRLVLRLVEATSGTLRLGGVPIADIPVDELRRRVALIPQEVELFGATVRDNVTMFDPAPSDDDVVAAMNAVGLDTLARGGLDRVLNPGGGGLSAGEGQLLSLARVWLRQPDLIVLDEATARVDPETEARIEAAVRRLTAGRTTLIIAHRLSTLDAVDLIAVFEAGELVEYGKRTTLADDPASRYARYRAIAAVSPEGVLEGAVE